MKAIFHICIIKPGEKWSVVEAVRKIDFETRFMLRFLIYQYGRITRMIEKSERDIRDVNAIITSVHNSGLSYARYIACCIRYCA